MDQLNQDVLLEIFNYLDAASLKNCAQTCTSWAKIIGFSSSVMKKLPLVIDYEHIGESPQNEKLKDIKRLKRNYFSLIIDEIRITGRVLSPIKAHTANIRILELVHVDLTEASWKALLQSLATIEKMTIIDSKLSAIKKKKSAETAISIPSLKALTVIDSDWFFFEYIGKTSIEELKIHNHTFYAHCVSYFLPFLILQKNLISLGARVQQIFFYQTLLSDENLCSFRLKKLSITFRHWNDEKQSGYLIEFLEQQKDTLEHLEADCKLTTKIFEFIFSNLKLHTLILNASYLPNEAITFYTSLRKNPHLKKLVLTGEFKSTIAAQGIFTIYRQIENLTIQNWSLTEANDILIAIVNYLTNISHLNIPFLVENSTELSMMSLKSLSIESLMSKTHIQSFIVNQRSLEKLSIKWIFEDINDVLEQAIPHLLNLKSVIFGPEFQPTLSTLKLFKENCQNLHTIEIFTDLHSPLSNETLSQVNGKGLKIIQYKNGSQVFPLEKTMWHEEDKLYINMSSALHSDTDSMDDDDFEDDSDDMEFSDDDYYNNEFFWDSDDDDYDYHDYNNFMIREVLDFLLH